jgi:hypothetical protein
VRELRPSLRRWEARHPEWRPTEPWSENVSFYAIDDGELLLFDPLAVPSELEDLAAGRETAIVLTAPWHERDAQRLVERLGVPVSSVPWRPPRAQAEPHSSSSTTEAERRMVLPSGSSTIAKRSFGVTSYGAQWPT